MKPFHFTSLLCLLMATSPALAEDVRWNGFLNIVGGVLKEEPTLAPGDNGAPKYEQYETNFTFDKQSSAGLQATMPLDDKNSVTVQIFADAATGDYDANFKWLYLTHIASDNSMFRVGRIGSPIYYYSDFLNVGYAYHWVLPPDDVYNYDTTMTGIDYIYQDVYNDHDWSLEFMIGSQDQFVPSTGSDISMRNVMGIVASFSQDGWLTYRAALFQMDATFIADDLQTDALIQAGFDTAVSQGRLDQATAEALQPVFTPIMAPLIDDVMRMEDERIRYAELGIRAERGRWFAMAEWTTFRTNTYAFNYLESWYITGGVRRGESVFHLTYARYDQYLDERARDDYNSVLPESPSTNDQIATYFARQIRATPAIGFASQWNTITLGISIDTSASTALKFELLHFDNEPTTATERTGTGHNMLFRTAFNVTF